MTRSSDEMTRTELLNSLIREFRYEEYLEIGVKDGVNFDRIQVKRRIGVDPNLFLVKHRFRKGGLPGMYQKVMARLGLDHWRYTSTAAELYELTSDEFFRIYTPAIDICFIDGLHHAEQVVRDYINVQRCLRPGGCVVIHDCNPLSVAAADRSREAAGHDWNGDVWKAIHWLRQQGQTIVTFPFDHGCGLAFKQEQVPSLPGNMDVVLQPDYEQLDSDRTGAVGLTAWEGSETLRSLIKA